MVSPKEKGGYCLEENISAEEASEIQGARLYEENVHKERPQGAVPQKSKGQKDALLLIYDYAFL